MPLDDLPLVSKCPEGGEEWPSTNFKCYIDFTAERVTPRRVTFVCPGDHSFNLIKAVEGGFLTKEQSKTVLADAKLAVEKHRKENPT